MGIFNKGPRKWDERDRGEGVKQRYTRVRPVEFEGSTKLEHREGGTYPLWVAETSPGLYLSSWMINAAYCKEFIKLMSKHPKRDVVLSLCVDTNVPGHPTVSMQLQEIFITED